MVMQCQMHWQFKLYLYFYSEQTVVLVDMFLMGSHRRRIK